MEWKEMQDRAHSERPRTRVDSHSEDDCFTPRDPLFTGLSPIEV
jgi:hypothetical protein